MLYHMAEVNILPLVEDSIEANRPLGSKQGVEIRLVAPLPGARVRADAERLMQVMDNLLANAIKFSKAGQIVDVSIERLSPWVRITVEDHGEGIPEADRDTLFKPFSRVDVGYVRRRGGPGLGLMIVDAIIADHGGRVSFDSAVDQGTRFYVDLKESTADAPRAAAPSQIAAD